MIYPHARMTGARFEDVDLADADLTGLRIRDVLVSDLLAAWDARPAATP